MAAPAEVLFTCEKSAQLCSVSVFDPYTGTTLMSYRGNSIEPRTLSLIRDDYVIGAVSNKPLLSVWAMQRRDQLQQRVVCPGKVTAMVVSPNGLYCVAAILEKIHIWQMSSGDLLAVLDKHYQTVRCLRFTDDSSHFVSGGDDNSVFVWSLGRLLSVNNAAGSNSGLEPKHSWTDHLLPITDIHVGFGGCRSRVVTGSRDKSVKVWDMASGLLLLTLTFDVEVLAVTVDGADYRIFVGATNGKIYQVNLFDKAVTSRSVVDAPGDCCFNGHTGPITCLSVSIDGQTLASGSNDSTVRLWNTSSRQCIRTLHHADSVTNLTFAPAPHSILDPDAPRPLMPFCQFKRHLVTAEENASKTSQQNAVNVRLHGFKPCQSDGLPEDSAAVLTSNCFSEVPSEREKLADELRNAKRKNRELYDLAVNKILKCD